MGDFKETNKNGHDSQEEQDQTQTMDLPSDLEKTMVEQFDHLVKKGEIAWAPYYSEPYEEGGFKVVFQRSPHLRKKPIQHANDPSRHTGKGSNPFINPDPNFVLSHLRKTHTLILNKYCVYRPSLVLHTTKFVPQSHDLDISDIAATWTLLKFFQQKYMMIYNCGVNSGSSQGHKHMQLWPLPSESEIGFNLFPSLATSTTEITDSIPHIPHRHFVLKLPSESSPESILESYQRLLKEIERCHDLYGSTAYNVAMTTEWICLIPRRSSGGEKGAGSNAAGVLGLVWIIDDREKRIWTERPSLRDFMGYIGLPIDGKEIGQGS